MSLATAARHGSEKFRQEPKRRRLTVARVIELTPNMRRIVLRSPELADFVSRSPDDHIKLFFADPASVNGVAMRDYTPRRFDAARQELTIDFALHEAGPATRWALGAAPGQSLEIGGPRGSVVVADDFDHYLLIGDETALPSIGRRLEGLRAKVPVTTIIVVEGPQEVQHIETCADWTPVWLFREGALLDDGALLRDAGSRRPATVSCGSRPRPAPPGCCAILCSTSAAIRKPGSRPPAIGSRARPAQPKNSRADAGSPAMLAWRAAAAYLRKNVRRRL